MVVDRAGTSLTELITLLCDEVGNAALDTYHQQFQKIETARAAANSNLETFAAKNLSAQEVADYSVRMWGVDLFDPQMSSRELFARLAQEPSVKIGMAINPKARRAERESVLVTLRHQAIMELARDRQEFLKAVLARDDLPRLHFDSGELTVKLDLDVVKQAAESVVGAQTVSALRSATGLNVSTADVKAVGLPPEQTAAATTPKTVLIAHLRGTEQSTEFESASLTIKFRVI